MTTPVNTAEVKSFIVGPGTFDSWLDTALVPVGLSSADAPRAPAAVREILEGTGATVDQVKWGSGDTAGRIYVRWKPERNWNAVDYANIAYRIFRAAELQFPLGTHIVMQRYRFTPHGVGIITPVTQVAYAYPVGAPPSDSNVPMAARRTLPEETLSRQLIASLPPPAEEQTEQPSDLARTVANPVFIASAALGALGLFFVWKGYQRRTKRNRRRS